MFKMRSFGLLWAPCFVSVFVGCQSEGVDEADAFRAALPLAESVQVDGPETNDESANVTENGIAADAPIATYYKFTRKVRDDVNNITKVILGSVWFVAHTTPTRVSAEEAVWGPYTDSLEPATYRFRMTKQGDGGYRYVYEGRPKESASDGDYRVVVDGVGYGKSDVRHGDGWFTIDLDVAKALDPVIHEDESGAIHVEHDLPVTVSLQVGALPRHIEVEASRTDSDEAYDIASDAHEDNTGKLVVTALADLELTGLTELEDVTVESQWNSSGAGRADVTIQGGDIPTALDPVTAVECWAATFKRSYYHDSAGIDADYGVAADCAFSSATE